MFSITFRSFAFPRKLCAAKNNLSPQRKFSIISVHTSFPATLYRFQPQRSSGLFDYQQDGADYEDALKVSNDGLIYPRVSHDHPCQCHLQLLFHPKADVVFQTPTAQS